MIIADFELTIYYESNQNVAVAKPDSACVA